MLRLNYVSFIVSDMQKALDFYRTLGLPIPTDADVSQDHIEIEQDGLRIAWETQEMIQSLGPDWTPTRQAGRVGFALQASSPAEVDAAIERVQHAGHTVNTQPWDAFWGQRYATVTDPDGINVDVFAWLKQ